MGAREASRADVSRLYARAAFGATAADLDTWTGRPYAEVVEHLLDVPSPDARGIDADEPVRLAHEQAAFYGDTAVMWWLERMRTTQWPLEERLVLFFHDHFATAWSGDRVPDIGDVVKQNHTIRRHALGSFRSLVEAITVDPAMLYYLSGYVNTAGKPNENYARELFELFTLGVIPQVYTEADIREAARALTGWIVNGGTRVAEFLPDAHDTGVKHVLGRTIRDEGAREYVTVVDTALAQPVARLFLAHKLITNFAYVPRHRDLLRDADPLVREVADALGPNWNLRAAVRTMLLSDRFRHSDAGRGDQSVRQPVEVAVHAAKAIGVPFLDFPVAFFHRMGQVPFLPPNVGGWPVGREWLSPTTLIARYDYAAHLFDVRNALSLAMPWPASGDLGGWAALLGLAGLSAPLTNAIRRYLAATADASEGERQKGVFLLIVTSPDWMVV